MHYADCNILRTILFSITVPTNAEVFISLLQLEIFRQNYNVYEIPLLRKRQ